MTAAKLEAPADPPRRSPLARWRWPILAAAVLLPLAAWLASGFVTVAPDERAVVRRFGAVTAQIGPGMHYRWPWPIARLDRLKGTSAMRTGVGLSGAEADPTAETGKAFLTGDTNILSVALALQFAVAGPADYLFEVEAPEELLRATAEGVLTEAILGMPVDEVLTTGRVAIQERVRVETQRLMDRYRSGIRLSNVSIVALTLDRTVAQAFQDVADAMADREKSRNEARAYTNNLLPKARGEAHATVGEARGRKERRVAEAVAETQRFLALEREYARAPDETRARLYADALATILPKVELYVVDTDGGRVPLSVRIGDR